MAATSPDKSIGQSKGPEAMPDVVSQPVKIESHLGGQLGSFLENINRMSESTGDNPGEQWSGSGGAVATQTSGSTPVVSARDQAMAAIPAPKVMQVELEKHIRMEVKKLRKQAKEIAGMNRPGAAYRLNILYTRIRHLNALLAEVLSASAEVLKRLFVRVFVDKQPIL